MILYTESLDWITPEHLHGFHRDWASPPTPEQLLQMMRRSTAVALATENGRVVGYATALSDETVFAYLSSIEVLPTHRGIGIGTQLANRIISRFKSLYALDLVCDDDLAPFYARFGMLPLRGMAIRRHPSKH